MYTYMLYAAYEIHHVHDLWSKVEMNGLKDTSMIRACPSCQLNQHDLCDLYSFYDRYTLPGLHDSYDPQIICIDGLP